MDSKLDVPYDRHRLMTALRDAVEVIKKLIEEGRESSPEAECLEGIVMLLTVRKTMEKNEDMETVQVFQFFSCLRLSPEQQTWLLKMLAKERITLCHRFLEISPTKMERMLKGRENRLGIPYPIALQALAFAYQNFQQPNTPAFRPQETEYT